MKYTKRQQKANRKKWVKALRSGKYKKGAGALRSGLDKYCCLGVLCAVAGIRPRGRLDGNFIYRGESLHAPKEAMAFVGLRCKDGSTRAGSQYNNITNANSLELMNDMGADFSQIADFIESEPPGLFTD